MGRRWRARSNSEVEEEAVGTWKLFDTSRKELKVGGTFKFSLRVLITKRQWKNKWGDIFLHRVFFIEHEPFTEHVEVALIKGY